MPDLFDGAEEVRAEAARIAGTQSERRRIVRRLALKAVEDAWRPAVEAEVARLLPSEVERVVRGAFVGTDTYGVRAIVERMAAEWSKQHLAVTVRVKEASDA